MSNHSLSEQNLMATLPQVLRDDVNMAALASSISSILVKRREEIRRVAFYSRIDELPEDLLDILANDFKVDWWDQSYSLEKKRQLLKNSWRVHRIIGTKAAVVSVLSDIYTDFRIYEWWEYGGKPHCFKVETSNYIEAIENFNRFIHVLSDVKRLSAHLDVITANLESSQHIGTGLSSTTMLNVEYKMSVPSEEELEIFLCNESGYLLYDEKSEVLTI